MSEEILLVEPDWTRKRVRRALEERGCRVHASDAGPALVRMAVQVPAGVVVDAASFGTAGETLRAIKRVHDVPVLLLARRPDQAEGVQDLLGVRDDCLVHPVAGARVAGGLGSIMRWAAAHHGTSRGYDDGWIAVDTRGRTASVAGRSLVLGLVEFTLLEALVSNAGSVLPPARLAEIACLPADRRSAPQVRLAITLLRAAVGPAPDGGSPIVTLPGYGYRYIPPVRAV